MNTVGILLAAGFSRRFGESDKLLQPLPNGEWMGVASAKHLIQAVPNAIAVIRAENTALRDALTPLGFERCVCDTSDSMMADSLTAGIRFARLLNPSVTGYVIALADMPFIHPNTIERVNACLSEGADIVIPTYRSQRGHPVAFSSRFEDALLEVSGDEGARSVIRQFQSRVTYLETDDAGILKDIDTPEDMGD